MLQMLRYSANRVQKWRRKVAENETKNPIVLVGKKGTAKKMETSNSCVYVCK